MEGIYSIWYSFNAFVKSLKNKSTSWHTDSFAAARFVKVGSNKEDLLKLIIDIFEFCKKKNMSLNIL